MSCETRVVQRDLVVRVYHCDVCGEEVETEYSAHICRLCGRFLCGNCVVFHRLTAEDANRPYCERCWGLGNVERPLILQLQEQTDIYLAAWKQVCAQAREKEADAKCREGVEGKRE